MAITLRILLSGLIVFSSGSAVFAQTEQWSQPTRTEQWSVPDPAPQPKQKQPKQQQQKQQKQKQQDSWSQQKTPPPAPSGSGQWSQPTYTQQVDPRTMDNPDIVAMPGPLHPGIVGTWDLWVPGGMWYSSDGSRVYRNYTPGADMNRLHIQADGSYRWGSYRGRLTEVKPWFAQAGERYYAVQMDSNTRYMARYDPGTGKLNMFFWGVGGHAASGTRI